MCSLDRRERLDENASGDKHLSQDTRGTALMSKSFLSSLVIIKFNDVSISERIDVALEYWIEAMDVCSLVSSIELRIENRNNKIVGKCRLFHELNYYCPNYFI